jgi:tetratricopeptide (TPR) repeat protein
LRGNEAFREGRYEDAWKHYSKAIEADPSVAQYCTNRANALWRWAGRQQQQQQKASAGAISLQNCRINRDRTH